MRTSSTRPFRLLIAPLLTIASVLFARDIHGQGKTGLEVTVRTSVDSVPLAGAQVFVKETGSGGITNGHGVVQLSGVRQGTWTVEVHALGYRLWSQAVNVAAGATTNVVAVLDVEPVAVKAVEATGHDSNLKRRGFFERKRHGHGTFLTAADIDAMQARVLSDVLRRYGVSVGSDARGRPSNRIRGQQSIIGSCPIQFYLDGVPAANYNADEMRPSDVQGLEIYKGAASIPSEFNRGTAACGVIVIWTKVD